MPRTGLSCLEREVEVKAGEEGKGERAEKSKVCCSCCWGRRRGQLDSCCWERPPPPHTPTLPLKQQQKSQLSRDLARTEQAAGPRSLPALRQLLCLELQPALVQFSIQTRCLGMLRNISCPWFFISPTESQSQH